MFSGRENPTLVLTGPAERKALDLLEIQQKVKAEAPPMPILGYRGLTVQYDGKKKIPKSFMIANNLLQTPKENFAVTSEVFEDFVCGSVPKFLKPPKPWPKNFQKILLEELKRYRLLKPWPPKIVWPQVNPCQCAPIYEPLWWNTGTGRQFNNNCYNYATNYRTDTFAQPGRGSGAIYTAITGPAVRAAAIRDELIDSPNADNKCPNEGHLVALVIWPNVDFHWYRKGNNGFWSHKPGSTQVTNLDNSGNPITDPRTANRGNYTQFITFMTVKGGHIIIR